ncbi:glycosyl transferase [Salinimicrobium marinum]|uniref:Glycosyl transferase n=1 Tax=Salinimicrobium marinum TaxID=680283 RepID=A0A918SL70_9FLAO|nr:glycosyltransferase [Salinimicrobium marinum]GHA50428.1 glycosyl transferase [Salinimicrobium marinum]
MDRQPLLSIIIPCYNDGRYIEQSVDSALNQTYPKIEVIVIDDGSNEETKAVLEKIKPYLTALITQDNRGQSSARNKGVKAARGDYILTLDSDDFFEPSFCEKAVKLIQGKEEVKIVTCYAKRLRNSGYDIFKPGGGYLKDFLNYNCALGTSLFRRREALAIGGYDESMRKGFEDWEFFIRLLKDGGKAVVIPEPLYNYRKRINTTTTVANKNKYALLRYLYSKHENLYKEHFQNFVDHLLNRIEREEKEKIKHTSRLEFIIGSQVLRPLRYFKSLIRL